jgi:flagellar motor protein MotB
MRLFSITFDRYGSGETDFAALISGSPQPGLNTLLDVVKIIATQITNPTPNLFVSIIVVGHSDRQDRTDFTCDQRRASEITAAQDRALSAWEWIKQQVTEVAAQSGVQAGEWWETSPRVTWGLVYTAAGMLQFDPPSDAQRPLNRRVVILVSIFNPE